MKSKKVKVPSHLKGSRQELEERKYELKLISIQNAQYLKECMIGGLQDKGLGLRYNCKLTEEEVERLREMHRIASRDLVDILFKINDIDVVLRDMPEVLEDSESSDEFFETETETEPQTFATTEGKKK